MSFTLLGFQRSGPKMRFTKAGLARRSGRAAHVPPAAGAKRTARAETGKTTGATSDAERCEWDLRAPAHPSMGEWGLQGSPLGQEAFESSSLAECR